jgi:hypothetical protein
LVELNHLTVPFSIVCLLSQSNFGAATAAARRVQVPRTAPQARFWGKVRNDRVGKTAPAGRQNPIASKQQTEKCGASMAAMSRALCRFASQTPQWFSAS